MRAGEVAETSAEAALSPEELREAEGKIEAAMAAATQAAMVANEANGTLADALAMREWQRQRGLTPYTYLPALPLPRADRDRVESGQGGDTARASRSGEDGEGEVAKSIERDRRAGGDAAAAGDAGVAARRADVVEVEAVLEVEEAEEEARAADAESVKVKAPPSAGSNMNVDAGA